jgi:hypothetical protein
MNGNPWSDLPNTKPFVLPQDKNKVEAFNKEAGQKHPLCLDLIPEAFLGRPDAPLVLLGNIAGVSETGDPPSPHRVAPAFLASMRNNLLHAPSNCPFVFFDPTLVPGSADWWDRKLKWILSEFGIGDAAKPILANNLFNVEFFPYVSCSNRYDHDRVSLPSQDYSFNLVRKATQQEAVIVLQDGERRGLEHGPVIAIRHGECRWLEKVPELKKYPRLVKLKSYQKGLITPNNCLDNGWQHIQDVVRAIKPKP